MPQRILVVDDEAAIRDTLRMVLEYEGYEVHTVGDGKAALAELDASPASAVPRAFFVFPRFTPAIFSSTAQTAAVSCAACPLFIALL